MDSINEGEGQNWYATDVIQILEIIVVADSHEKLIHDISKYCDSKEDDIFKIFNFIITAKNKEDLQMKTVKYLCSRLPLLFRILGKLSCDTSNQAIRETVMNHFQKKQEDVYNSLLICNEEKHASENDGKEKEKGVTKKKKRRKSKYSEIDGDLSHIQREPKRSKGIYQTDSSSEEYVKQSDNSNANEDLKKVHSMIDILRERSCEQSRKDVIDILRTDSKIRHLFMKEKARLGVRNIPVLLPPKEQHSKVDSQREDGRIETSNYHVSVSEEKNKEFYYERKESEIPETFKFHAFGPSTYNGWTSQHGEHEIHHDQLPLISQYFDNECGQTGSYEASNMCQSNSCAQNFTTLNPACIHSYNEATISTQVTNEHFHCDWTMQYDSDTISDFGSMKQFAS